MHHKLHSYINIILRFLTRNVILYNFFFTEILRFKNLIFILPESEVQLELSRLKARIRRGSKVKFAYEVKFPPIFAIPIFPLRAISVRFH